MSSSSMVDRRSADRAPSDRVPATRPRLLYVVNAAWFFVSHRLPLAVAAREQGYDVHVAAAPDDSVGEIRRAGLHFHPIAFDRRGANPAREAAALLALWRLYRRLDVDIVHHVTIKPLLYGGIAARLARVPVAIHAVSGLGYVFLSDGMGGAVGRRGIRLAYRAALRHPNQVVIFQNRDDLGSFLDARLVASRDTALVRGAGVDTEVFRPAGPRDEPSVVVLAARMLRHKGVHEFVAAARELTAAGVRARFVLVGSSDPGNPSAIAPETLQAWNAEGVVEWWGHRADMAAVFQRAAIACLPSYREGLPKVLLEAAACGLPIVTTDVPGCRDVVTADNGLLVPAGSHEHLVSALGRLIADPGLRAQMGTRGRQMVIREFHVNRVIGETLAIYADRLARAGRRSHG